MMPYRAIAGVLLVASAFSLSAPPPMYAEDRVYRFDFGPEGSPVWSKDFRLVTERGVYTEKKGYGFVGGAGARTGDRGEVLDELRRDHVAGTEEATFRLDLPEGKYLVYVILGDYRLTCYSNHTIIVHARGQTEGHAEFCLT